MADETEPANDAADYAREAQKMRDAAARTFDPALAAQYLALAAEWLRLADARAGARADLLQPDPGASQEDA